MKKEEILEQARKDNKGKCDERELLARDQSLRWSYIVLVVTAAFFTAIRAERGLPMMDLCATVCASVCAGMMYRFIKTKNRSCLLLAVITFLVAIAATIRFFMGH